MGAVKERVQLYENVGIKLSIPVLRSDIGGSLLAVTCSLPALRTLVRSASRT